MFEQHKSPSMSSISSGKRSFASNRPHLQFLSIARRYWGLLVIYLPTKCPVPFWHWQPKIPSSSCATSQGHDSFSPFAVVFPTSYCAVPRTHWQPTRHPALNGRAEHRWDMLLPMFPMKGTPAPLSCVWTCIQSNRVSHSKFPTAAGISLT